jgi:uncharacterized protein HemX
LKKEEDVMEKMLRRIVGLVFVSATLLSGIAVVVVVLNYDKVNPGAPTQAEAELGEGEEAEEAEEAEELEAEGLEEAEELEEGEEEWESEEEEMEELTEEVEEVEGEE